MHVPASVMVAIGLFMIYRLLKQRERLHTGVFIFWLILFGAVSVLAALVAVHAIPATI